MRNIVVFGGSGFIGRYLIEVLEKQSQVKKVYNFDLRKPKSLYAKEKFIECDIRNPVQTGLFNDGEAPVIINLAAIHRNPGHEKHEYYEANVDGAKNIIDFAQSVHCNKIVFISSIAVYGASDQLKTEESQFQPDTDYGMSKVQAEERFQDWATRENGSLLILRPGIVFGFGENGNFDRLLKLMRLGAFPFMGRKDTVKSCIYVKDLSSLIWESILSHRIGCFNAVYFKSESIFNICLEMKRKMKLKTILVYIPKPIASLIFYILGAIGQTFRISKLLNLVERAKKLVHATNISSDKLKETGFEFQLGFSKGISDWSEQIAREKAAS